MALRFSALRTRHNLLPRNIIFMFLVLTSVRGWVNPRAWCVTWKIIISTQLREILYTDSEDMLVRVLPSIVASGYHNCCTDDSTSSGNYKELYVYSPILFGIPLSLSLSPSLYIYIHTVLSLLNCHLLSRNISVWTHKHTFPPFDLLPKISSTTHVSLIPITFKSPSLLPAVVSMLLHSFLSFGLFWFQLQLNIFPRSKISRK
jgi:hypothetical protein